jgi:uncharacterized protein (DUF608 family)
MAGPPLSFYTSDTYHMSSVIGTYEYVVYSGDVEFLARNWQKIKFAIQFIAAKVDSTGMLYVTGNNDWGRFTQGGYNTQANALMYKTFTTGSLLASWRNESSLAQQWTARAAALKAKINSPAANIWEERKGYYYHIHAQFHLLI